MKQKVTPTPQEMGLFARRELAQLVNTDIARFRKYRTNSVYAEALAHIANLGFRQYKWY